MEESSTGLLSDDQKELFEVLYSGTLNVIFRRFPRARYELSAVVSSGAWAADLTPVK